MKRTNTSVIGIGTQFHYIVGDSNSLWEVKKKISASVWQAQVIDDYDYSGTVKVFSTEEIKQILDLENMWNNIHKRGEEEWFALIKKHGLKPGDFVHDVSTHGKEQPYAWRCTLLPDGKVKRIGLVGDPEDFLMPYLNYNIGQGKVTVRAFSLKNMAEEPRVWGNRPKDFAELNGDFSWRDKPLNIAAVTLPEITPEVLKKKNQLEVLHAAYNKFISDEISLDEVKEMIINL